MIHTIQLYGKSSCRLRLALLMLFPLLAAFAFPSGAASIFKSAETSWVTTTDARIAANATNAVNISAHGCDYGTSKDNLDQHISDGAASGHYIFYFVFSEYGRTLKPNTTYYWRIWSTVDGVKHYTDIYSFKTKEEVPLIWPVPHHAYLSQGLHDNHAIDLSDGSISGADVVAAMSGTVIKKYTCTKNHYGDKSGDCCYFR